MYYFVNWRKSLDGEGIEPDLPEDIGFTLVTDNRNSNPRWGIFELRLEEDGKYELISDLLVGLLDSASRFPPIYAISKYRMEKETKSNKFTKMEFDARFCEIIKVCIDECKSKQYVFAKAREDEIGYLYANEYYWVLRSNNENGKLVVSWVSDDYYIYQIPASNFELSIDELCILEKNA